jgi:hypothetical protein
MADPLAIIGTIGVAAQAASKLVEILSTIRNAPSEIRDLNTDVQGLKSVLVSAQSLCSQARTSDLVLLQTMNECVLGCQSTIAPLDEFLRPYAKQDGSSTTRRLSLGFKVQWAWKKDGVLAMKAKLVDSRGLLGLAVAVLNGCVFSVSSGGLSNR